MVGLKGKFINIQILKFSQTFSSVKMIGLHFTAFGDHIMTAMNIMALMGIPTSKTKSIKLVWHTIVRTPDASTHVVLPWL